MAARESKETPDWTYRNTFACIVLGCAVAGLFALGAFGSDSEMHLRLQETGETMILWTLTVFGAGSSGEYIARLFAGSGKQ